jgi:hypothetical protein
MKISELLNESGPSRILRHIRDGTPFVMVSAFSPDVDHETNLRRDARMKHIVSGMLLSYIQTDGEYTMHGSDEPMPEKSIFLMATRGSLTQVSKEKLRSIGEKLMHAFNQESIAYGDGKMVWLVFNDGSEEKLGNRLTFRPEVIATLGGSSTISSRKFSYTDADKAPGAGVYGMA